ncbi:hypothetical protein F4810DRAFT_681322 [Camillea tinctor]|nr:hypothetical protein F4810DRAFT_681322 [Camillea tinctor]
MCIRSSQRFSRCGHRDTKLAHCPQFYKQQSSTSGLMSCLFQKKKKQDCGKAIQYYVELESFCRTCALNKSLLKTENFGGGTFRVQRPTIEDELRNMRKLAAKESYKTAKHDQQSKKYNHEVISVKPSVWLPDLYHHPDTIARGKKYARETPPAPPASSPPQNSAWRIGSPRSSTRMEAKNITRDGHFNKACGHSRHTTAPGTLSINADHTPVSGKPASFRAPVEPALTHLYQGKLSHKTSSLPPAGGLPPVRGLARQEAIGGKPLRLPRSDPPYEPNSTERVRPREKQPELRHKNDRIYNIAAVRPPKAPVPEYQVYLNAMNYVAAKSPSDKPQPVKPTNKSRLKTQPNLHHQYAKEEPRRSALQTFMGWSSANKPYGDDGSDASFVCQDSRKLMEPKARRRVARR